MARHIKFQFHHNQVCLAHFTTKSRSHSFFYTWPQQLYESSNFGTYTYKTIFGPLSIFVKVGQRFALVAWNTQKGRRASHWLDHFGSLLWRVFQTFFSKCWRYRLERWFIHSVGCTTYWVHISPEWGPCALFHVPSLGTVNYQSFHWCWHKGVLGSLWLLLFIMHFFYYRKRRLWNGHF